MVPGGICAGNSAVGMQELQLPANKIYKSRFGHGGLINAPT